MAGDPHKYSAVLKELIVQCLIKLLENDVEIRCREEDVSLIEGIVGEAVDQY